MNTFKTYDAAYHEILRQCYNSKSGEILGLSFTLLSPLDRTVDSKTRNFRTEFAEAFYSWIISGSSEVSDDLIRLNPRAKDYVTEVDGRNIAYGPRITAQLGHIVEELRHSPDSRRGTLLILSAEDQSLLSKKRSDEHSNKAIEYPCTIGQQFIIRDNKLHTHVFMRSNNMVLTVCYDVYNFTKLQEHVANLLGVEVGKYIHTISSAHILPNERELAKKILEERYGSLNLVCHYSS